MESDPWAEYARLQAMLDRVADAYKGIGIETAMSDLLEKIARGETCRPSQIKNLVVNRSSKERRRRAMVAARRHELPSDDCSDGAAESSLDLQACQKICGDRDFVLLVNQAAGCTYADLARQTGINQNTLKIRVHRARHKIESLAA